MELTVKRKNASSSLENTRVRKKSFHCTTMVVAIWFSDKGLN